MKKTMLALLAAALCAFALLGAIAEGETVIMNIPYTQFYAAELDLPADYQVDAVTSATEKNYKNPALVGGSYSIEIEDGTHAIEGVSFPVYVADAALLEGEGFAEVADAETLAVSGDYSYYIPESAPEYYKELTVDGDVIAFGAVQNLPEAEVEGVTPVLDEVKGRRGDYKIDLEGFDFETDGAENIVYAVVVRTADAAYPLRHLENIFTGNELAINAGSSKLIKGVNPAMPRNYEDIVGQTITEIDYYTSQGYYAFPADIELPGDLDNKGYVLMNIPYDKFYEAEVTDASTLDAVSSATLMKTRTGALSGGSYHVAPEGSDISGVIYPVYVDDLAALADLGGVEITDESSVEITVTNRSEETTTAYEGSAALFEAPSYSWYVMQEGSLPKQYKKLDMDALTFSTINKKDKALEAAAAWVYDKHADLVIAVSGAEEKLDETDVSGIVLIADDSTAVGLKHIENIWRKYQMGFSLDSAAYAALKGKTITGIRYITQGANYIIDVDLPVAEDELLTRLNGSYIELFPEFARDEYKDYWMECIKAYVDDDETAEAYYTALTQTYMGTLKGQAAIDAYGENPEGMLFDCYFENGLAKLTVSGNVISGEDAEGNELFRHAYEYVGDRTVSFFGEELDSQLHLYKTEDADAGDFTYFAFADDTPGETQHIEYRYGASEENLANYSEGEYAYWLASGILDGYRESMIQDCIRLFVDENVGGQGD
ncbi:MAG: hypothetical protein IJ769_04420 [Clostridia bacterium]|nr:hypothetical protein [Clostridia bacterium]